MRMKIKYPDGVIHNVNATSLKKAFNRKTGKIELILEYTDYTMNSQECFTPVINIDGIWYKNKDHSEFMDYEFGIKQKNLLNLMPESIETYSPYLYIENPQEVRAQKSRDYLARIIYNLINNKKPELLQNVEIQNLLYQLLDKYFFAYRHCFCNLSWDITYCIQSNLIDSISSALDGNVDNLCFALRTQINLLTNFSEPYERINTIYDICRTLGLINNPIIFEMIFLINDSMYLMMDNRNFENFIRELEEVLNEVRDTPTFGPDQINTLLRRIALIVAKYKLNFKEKKQSKETLTATELPSPPGPPGPPGTSNNVNLEAKTKEKLKPDNSNIVKPKHIINKTDFYVLVDPESFFDIEKRIKFSTFRFYLNAVQRQIKDGEDLSIMYYDLIFGFPGDVAKIRDYLNQIRQKSLSSIEPLYFELEKGYYWVCNFIISDTKEKYRDLTGWEYDELNVETPIEELNYEELYSDESQSAHYLESALKGKYTLNLLDENRNILKTHKSTANIIKRL